MSAAAPDQAFVIGLDIGTTSTMAVLVQLPDRIVASASRPVRLSSPHVGWAEEDPAEWWENSQRSAARSRRRRTGSVRPPRRHLRHRHAAGGRADRRRWFRSATEHPAERWPLQRRGPEIASEIDEATFLARTGNGINQQLVAAKLRWIARHEPDVFRRITTVFGSYDFINMKLTGIRAVEQNWAIEAGFIDLATHEIGDDLVALARLPRSAVPEHYASHQRLGSVTTAAAQLTGLPAGLPVFGGAADHIASAFAAGLIAPGDVLLKFGGAGDIIVISDTVRPDPRLFLDYHLVPGLYAPNGCMAATGSALNWLATILAPAAGADRPHRALDVAAGAIPAGQRRAHLPALLPRREDADPRSSRARHIHRGQPQSWRRAISGEAYWRLSRMRSGIISRS